MTATGEETLEKTHRETRKRPARSFDARGWIMVDDGESGVFYWLLFSGRSLREAMAIIFVLLVMIEFFKAYNFRSDRVSALQRPFANRWLNLAILAELAFLVAIVYAPFFHLLLGTFSMHRADWLLVVGLAATNHARVGVPKMAGTARLARRVKLNQQYSGVRFPSNA